MAVAVFCTEAAAFHYSTYVGYMCRPGGVFAFPVGAPQPITSGWYWALAGFDLAMRVRNAVWRPPFVMYYRTCPLHAISNDRTASGFTVTTVPLTALGRREDGSTRDRLLPPPLSHPPRPARPAAGLPLIGVSVLPRRTAGQDRPIARPDARGCAAAEHSDPDARIIRSVRYWLAQRRAAATCIPMKVGALILPMTVRPYRTPR